MGGAAVGSALCALLKILRRATEMQHQHPGTAYAGEQLHRHSGIASGPPDAVLLLERMIPIRQCRSVRLNRTLPLSLCQYNPPDRYSE